LRRLSYLVTGGARDFKFGTVVGHSKSQLRSDTDVIVAKRCLC